MNSKKVLGFLLCSSAFTKKNISSVGLVFIFLLVYVLAGGKIDTKLPRPNQVGSFGGTDLNSLSGSTDASKQVLGIVPTEARDERESAGQGVGRTFTNSDAEEELQEPIDRSGLIVGQKKVYGSDRERARAERDEKYRKDSEDPFAAIENRLNKKSYGD